MQNQLEAIQKILVSNSTPEAMAASKKFVPGVVKVYGVRMPLLNQLAKQFKEGGFELVHQLWQSGAFEEKILAAKILGIIAKKDAKRSLELVHEFSK